MIRALADWLKLTNRTVDGFAAELGVSRQTVHRYLNGSRFPRRSIIQKIERLSEGAVPASAWFAGSLPEAAE